MLRTIRLLSVSAATALAVSSVTSAQQPDSTRTHEELLTRLHARPTAQRIAVDGLLNEDSWQSATVVTDFRQVEPHQGERSEFETSVRVLYDANNIYFGIFCRDSLGKRGIRVQDVRRKFDYYSNDLFGISIDALHDGRNVSAFQITPYGAQRELQVFDDAVYNREWEGVWSARTAITDSGWTAEIAIPWSTLRYATDGLPWNINFYRIARRTNETSAWHPWPRAFTAYRVSSFGELDSLRAPPPTARIRVRPYALAQSDRAGVDAKTFGSISARFGGELTWNPTSNSALDITANTDFAQAEVDRQVINTGRYSVFFPERRQFFLESGSLFDVGPDGFAVKPFFSRRIGLDENGIPIRIDGGARWVRRARNGNDGALLVRQEPAGENGASTFGVVRSSRNIGATSRVGAMIATRFDEIQPLGVSNADNTLRRGASTRVVGALDGFTRVGTKTAIDGMIAAQTPGDGQTTGLAASASILRTTNVLSAGMKFTVVSKDFVPVTGFVSGTNVLVSRPSVLYDWRPRWKPGTVLRFHPAISTTTYHNLSDHRLSESFTEAYVDVDFVNGALIYPDVQHDYQRLTLPFTPVSGVTIPAGTYSRIRERFYIQNDQSDRVSGYADVSTGGYFDRSLTSGSFQLRYAPSPLVAAGISYSINRFSSADSGIYTHLLAPELRLAINPRLLLTSFYQYNSSIARGAVNVRASWEFAPLSYVYLVVNDLRGIGQSPGVLSPQASSQRAVLKFTWLRQL